MTILRGRLGHLDGRHITNTLLRTLPAAAVAAAAAWAASRFLGYLLGHGASGILTELAAVLGGVSVGVLAFGILALIFKIEEVDEVKTALLRRWRA